MQGTPHQIRFDPPPREIIIDGSGREMCFQGVIPVVLVPPTLPPGATAPTAGPKLVPHGIRFDGPDKEIFIDNQSYSLPFNRAVRIRIGYRNFEAAFGEFKTSLVRIAPGSQFYSPNWSHDINIEKEACYSMFM